MIRNLSAYQKMITAFGLSLVCLCNLSILALSAPEPTNAKQALSEFNRIIGNWKGVGQVKRNSTDGAWRENNVIAWKIAKNITGIEFKITDGKQIQSALVTWSATDKQYHLTANMVGDKKREYLGSIEKDTAIFESKADSDGVISRITIKQLSDIRLLILYEQRRESQALYSRIAEVGYTREGARLATTGQSGPVCIVTGGAGTIQVSHKGQSYFVCCTGCKEAFDNDPETYIAEYKSLLQKTKAGTK